MIVLRPGNSSCCIPKKLVEQELEPDKEASSNVRPPTGRNVGFAEAPATSPHQPSKTASVEMSHAKSNKSHSGDL